MRPDVFVVWAHTSPGWDAAHTRAWRDTVRGLTELLNDLGANAECDQDYEDEPVDWSTLCLQRMEDADRIVVAVSPGWKLAFSGRNPRSRGAEYECQFLRGLLMNHPDEFVRRVVIVVLPGAERADIPLSLACLQRYEVDPAVPASAAKLKPRLFEQGTPPVPEVPRLRELARARDPEVVTELLHTTVYLPDPGRPGLFATTVDGHGQSVLVFTDIGRLVEYRRRKGLAWEDRWLEVEGAELLSSVRPLDVGVVVDAGAPDGETVFVSAADIRVLTG